MRLSEYMESVMKAFDGSSQEVTLSFELCLDADLEVVNDSPNKIKFTVRTK